MPLYFTFPFLGFRMFGVKWIIFYLLVLTGKSAAVAVAAEAEKVMEAKNVWKETIWIAVVSDPNSVELKAMYTGFILTPGNVQTFSIPSNWSGFVWARTGCHVSNSSGAAFHCLTGDCGSGAVACPRGASKSPDATFAHFRAGDFGVSAVAGFNVAVTVTPKDECSSEKDVCAEYDLTACPHELQVVDGGGEVVGCKNGFEYNHDDPTIASTRIACFSARYRILFAAFCLKIHSPPMVGNKFPSPDEPASHDKKSSKHTGKIVSCLISILLSLIASCVSYYFREKIVSFARNSRAMNSFTGAFACIVATVAQVFC